MRRTGWIMLAVGMAVQLAVGEMLPIVNATFDEKDAKGQCAGWRLSNRMTVGKNAGHNGSAGLLWESETPAGKVLGVWCLVPGAWCLASSR